MKGISVHEDKKHLRIKERIVFSVYTKYENKCVEGFAHRYIPSLVSDILKLLIRSASTLSPTMDLLPKSNAHSLSLK